MTDEESSPTQRGHTRAILALLVLNLVIYAQVLGLGLIEIWDDFHYFLQRDLLDTWTVASWYERLATPDIGYPIPVPTALYFVVQQLPDGFVVPAAHALNLGFHLICALLIYAVSSAWLSTRRAALAVAALWSAHPVLVESVAWITNLKSVGSSAALLGGIYLADRYARTDDTKPLVAMALLLVVGLGFKPTAGVFLPLMAIVVFLRQPKALKRPAMIGFSILTGIFTALYLLFATSTHREQVADARGFEAVDYGYDGILHMLERMGAGFFVQIRNILRPLDLHPAYYADRIGPLETWLGVGLLAVLLGLAVWCYWKNRTAAMGLAVFWMTYLPYSGIEFLPRFTADTYAYLPVFGLLLAAAAVVDQNRDALFPKWERVVNIAVVGLVIVFGAISFLQVQRWDNSETLWHPVVERYPDVYELHFVMGVHHFQQADYERALEFHHRAYELDPDAAKRELYLPRTLERLGQPDAAFELMIDYLGHDAPVAPNAESYAVWLFVEYELALPDAPDRRDLILDAIPTAIERAEFDSSERSRLSEVLDRYGREVEAANFKE